MAESERSKFQHSFQAALCSSNRKNSILHIVFQKTRCISEPSSAVAVQMQRVVESNDRSMLTCCFNWRPTQSSCLSNMVVTEGFGDASCRKREFSMLDLGQPVRKGKFSSPCVCFPQVLLHNPLYHRWQIRPRPIAAYHRIQQSKMESTSGMEGYPNISLPSTSVNAAC